MSKPCIAVTGGTGQAGGAIRALQSQWQHSFDFIFPERSEFDLSDENSIAAFFGRNNPSYFINCAAYTAVDKAETERDIALKVNGTSAGLVAKYCALHDCVMLQVSTDYVFNGQAATPYQPDDATDPVNYYGYTKLVGEQSALANNSKTIVVRTSWVYGSTGHNFVKTMLRLMNERDSISVVNDQVGSPTYAPDLAEVLLQIVQKNHEGNPHYGIFHFSNDGVISWYDFASAIREMTGLSCEVKPISTSAYPTPAKRPAYSVMDKSRLQNEYGIVLKDWKASLKACIAELS